MILRVVASKTSGMGAIPAFVLDPVAAWRKANPGAKVTVRDFLGFIGITDVEFVYAEGLAISEESKNASLARAYRKIGDIAAPEAIAA